MRQIVAICSAMLSFGQHTLASEIKVEESVGEETPRVGDWFEANWFDELVKIPLSIDEGTNWYANLIVGESGS